MSEEDEEDEKKAREMRKAVRNTAILIGISCLVTVVITWWLGQFLGLNYYLPTTTKT